MSMPDRLRYYAKVARQTGVATVETVRDGASNAAQNAKRVTEMVNKEIAAMNSDPQVRSAVDKARLRLATSDTQEGQAIAAGALVEYAARRTAGLRGTDEHTAQGLGEAAGALARLATRYIQRRRRTLNPRT